MARSFVRALRFRWLTPFYDVLVDTLFHLDARKRRLVEVTASCGGEQLMDVGGGTGTRARLLLRADPRCRVLVIDRDLEMLLRARPRVAHRGWLVAASAGELPVRPGSIDRVLSSMAFHHLPPAVKRAALAEIRAALRPGGWFCLLDFDRPRDPLSWLLGLPARLIDGWANTRDNFAGRLPGLIAQVGFDPPEELAREWTPIGPLVYSRAQRVGLNAPADAPMKL